MSCFQNFPYKITETLNCEGRIQRGKKTDYSGTFHLVVLLVQSNLLNKETEEHMRFEIIEVNMLWITIVVMKQTLKIRTKILLVNHINKNMFYQSVILQLSSVGNKIIHI
jgi:hypothetical protein